VNFLSVKATPLRSESDGGEPRARRTTCVPGRGSRGVSSRVFCVCVFFKKVVPSCFPLSALLQLTGVLDDCFCDVESIDVFNNFKIYPLIKKLTGKDYFRYYRVNTRHALGGKGNVNNKNNREIDFRSSLTNCVRSLKYVN